VEKALEQNHPDLVIFSFGAYHFIVGTVGLRVRRRYGERAYRLFRRAEVFFEGKTASPEGRPARLNHWGRWLARRVIGAEALGTEEEVTAIHLEIMRLLAQREGLVVVVMLAPPVAESLDRENKGANNRLAKYREYMNGVARSHHFLVADCVPGFAAAARAGALRHSDGVHKGAAGHRIQADAIMDVLLHPPSPLAEKAAAATAL
jgi:lysophospholipase L1-like esterase